MALPRALDNTAADSYVTRLRRRRFSVLLDMINGIAGPVTILDVGGTPEYWQLMLTDEALWDRLHVTVVNITDRGMNTPHLTTRAGDARAMPEFRDKQFSIVFSNSTIEHVGTFDDQRRMADEVRRIGQRYYVQTPNRYFPIEPHFMFPFFQFLPLSVAMWLARHVSLGSYGRMQDPVRAKREITEIRLLTTAEMKELFPDASILKERIGGLTKSIVATR